MTYVTVNVDVDVDLYEVDTDDLVAELESRNKLPLGFGGECTPEENNDLLRQIYEAKRCGKDYERDLDLLIFRVLGRIL